MHRLVVAISLAGVLGLASCSGDVASRPTPRPTQSSLPTQLAGWKTFSSTDYGYSLSYPPTWFDIGSFGNADEHYFSNNGNAGSPMDVYPDGVFVSVSANCQYSLGRHTTLVTRANVAVGTVNAIRYVVRGSSPDGTYFSAIATIKIGLFCYRIDLFAFTLPVVQSNLADFDLLLQTLRFSSRTAPAATPLETLPPTQ